MIETNTLEQCIHPKTPNLNHRMAEVSAKLAIKKKSKLGRCSAITDTFDTTLEASSWRAWNKVSNNCKSLSKRYLRRILSRSDRAVIIIYVRIQQATIFQVCKGSTKLRLSPQNDQECYHQ